MCYKPERERKRKIVKKRQIKKEMLLVTITVPGCRLQTAVSFSNSRVKITDPRKEKQGRSSSIGAKM